MLFYFFPESWKISQINCQDLGLMVFGMICALHLVLVIWELQLSLQLFPLFMLSLQIVFLGVDLRLEKIQ